MSGTVKIELLRLDGCGSNHSQNATEEHVTHVLVV